MVEGLDSLVEVTTLYLNETATVILCNCESPNLDDILCIGQALIFFD